MAALSSTGRSKRGAAAEDSEGGTTPAATTGNGKPKRVTRSTDALPRQRPRAAPEPPPAGDAPEPPAPFSAFSQRAASLGLHIPARLAHDGVAVDLEAYELRVDGEVRPATPRQLEILAVFLATPRHVWNRDVLAQLIGTNAVSTRSIDVQLSRIRTQIGKGRLRTVTNRGWVLDAVEP
jgi:Transcriptional regulatory protein, C terminal